ncbi:NCAPH [Cervus elaphus hippelaphus]|uniref:Condensin complex subunit 2 n=1 Tax=Cervus elaphus hippelaphus TaxID=46360 RepID=A0A212CXY4_CEREH|nr:NCAPH [Cervus elaphus hippelaphus]
MTVHIKTDLMCYRDEVIPLGDGDIWTLCPLLSMKPGEYSYFSPRTMSMWAGPDHWRFRPRHKRDTASQSEHRKKSSKDFKIDFDDDIDFDVHFRKTKLLKVAQGQKAGTEHDEEIGDYDYNNPNDTSNFCPGLQAADSDYEESDDLFVGPAGTLDHSDHPSATTQGNGEASKVHGPDITTYGESNLVAEPQKVNKIEIQYAKTAKKMDMKKLKQSMWSLLTEIPKQADAEVNHSENGEAGPFEEGADKKLSSLTKDLQKSLPPLMAQNLSIPLAFACLLHLANEKNLKLEGTKDLSDVLVRQED